MKFEALYNYLESHMYDRDKEHPLYLVKKFCEFYELPFDRIKKIVNDFGGFTDTEILLNVVHKISGDREIELDIETPVEFAERNNLYCKWHTGGWISCKKEDSGSTPDLNAAYTLMEPQDGR